MEELGQAAVVIAEAEGLGGHAQSLRIRQQRSQEGTR